MSPACTNWTVRSDVAVADVRMAVATVPVRKAVNRFMHAALIASRSDAPNADRSAWLILLIEYPSSATPPAMLLTTLNRSIWRLVRWTTALWGSLKMTWKTSAAAAARDAACATLLAHSARAPSQASAVGVEECVVVRARGAGW